MKRMPILFLLLLSGVMFAQTGGKKVVASVNDGIEITLSELQGEIGMLPQERLSAVTTKEGVQQILDQLIQRKLLATQARNLQMDTVTVVKEAVRRSEDLILADFIIMNLRASTEGVTEEEAEKFYTQNESLFYSSPRLELKQIVAKDQSEAEAVKGELDAGKEIDKLIEKYPGVPEVAQSGDLGKLLLTQLSPNVVAVVEELKPGEWGGPVRTESGFHFLYVVSREESKKLKYEDVAETLPDELTGLKARNTVSDYIQSLVDEAKVTIDNSVLKEAIIQQRPGQ